MKKRKITSVCFLLGCLPGEIKRHTVDPQRIPPRRRIKQAA
jgi:hypothetical protein